MDERTEEKRAKNDQAWYIWYTNPRAEKKVRDRLLAKSVDVYLPIRRELKQWSDRKKWVESPLFSCYIFTRISQAQWDTVAYTEGMVGFVRFEGKPAVLRASEMEQVMRLAELSADGLEVAPGPIAPGEKIEVMHGPLAGMTGELLSCRGKRKLAVRMEQFEKVLLVELPAEYVRLAQTV